MTSYTAIGYTVSGHIAAVMLNRPEARNGHTPAKADEPEHAFKAADADPSVRVAVFTCAGPEGSGDSRESVVRFLKKRPPSFPWTVSADVPEWLPCGVPRGTP